MHEKEQDIIYEISTMRPMSSVFIGKLITGLAFAYSMVWMPMLFQLLFAFISVSILVPLFKEYWYKQIKGIRLTNDYLDVTRGANSEVERIYLDEIKRIELVEKHKNQMRRRRHRREGEVATVLFESEVETRHYHPETKCVITDKQGRRYDIECHFFLDGDFDEFLKVFEQTYARLLKGDKTPLQPNATLHTGLPNEKVIASMIKQHPSVEKIAQIIAQNNQYLQEDIDLKHSIEQNLLEAYEGAYHLRDTFEITKMPNPEIIYEYKKSNESKTLYILKEDYLEKLDPDTLAIGKNIIEACHKNIKLVETRIAYYQKIEQKLEQIKFQIESRLRFQKLTNRLKNLQERNTNKSIDQNMVNVSDNDIDTRVLHELAELSHKVHNLEDLENAVILNEHISLFKEHEAPKDNPEKNDTLS
ncbi:MAG: hypothetical protein JJT94_05965 [Bernardetiaceae bacterium]|nr:hypothetical protein [Bernardetiaceae bacterium]